MAIMANPQYLPKALAQLYLTVDEIWCSAGDTATDYNWYTKRSLLSAVYASTEVFNSTLIDFFIQKKHVAIKPVTV